MSTHRRKPRPQRFTFLWDSEASVAPIQSLQSIDKSLGLLEGSRQGWSGNLIMFVQNFR